MKGTRFFLSLTIFSILVIMFSAQNISAADFDIFQVNKHDLELEIFPEERRIKASDRIEVVKLDDFTEHIDAVLPASGPYSTTFKRKQGKT